MVFALPRLPDEALCTLCPLVSLSIGPRWCVCWRFWGQISAVAGGSGQRPAALTCRGAVIRAVARAPPCSCGPGPEVHRGTAECTIATVPGGSLRDEFFFCFLLRTALKDRPKGPPTANRQLPSTANRQPPTAANRQRRPTANCQPLPTASNHQPPATNRRQPPPTATNRQLPTANRQPPTATSHG